MNRLNSEVDSLLESDEVSQIDGIRFQSRSRSYSNVHDYAKQKHLPRTNSVRGLEPDIAKRRRKYEEHAKRKLHRRARDRQFEKSIEESITSELEGDFSDSTSYSELGGAEESTSESSSRTSSERRRKKKPTKKEKKKPPEVKPAQKKSITNKLKERITRKKKTSAKKPKSPQKTKEYEILPPHTRKEVIELTKGYIPVPRSKWDTIEAGSHILWMNKGSGRVNTKGAYYWYQKENTKGKMFFYCGPTANCDLKTPWIKRSAFPLWWDNVKKLFVREDPFTNGLRLAIDNRTIQLSDIAVFLKMKYGDEFEQFMKNRALERKARVEQTKNH